jgi:hypothetical protein
MAGGRADGAGVTRALCTEFSGLLGLGCASSYHVGASASQYSCVPEPLPDFPRGGGGEGKSRAALALGAFAPDSLRLHIGPQRSPE